MYCMSSELFVLFGCVSYQLFFHRCERERNLETLLMINNQPIKRIICFSSLLAQMNDLEIIFNVIFFKFFC